MSTSEKSILITGGWGTVGSGVARYFVAQGWRVILTARDEEKLTRANAETGATQYFPVDLADTVSIATLYAWLEANGGVPDVLLNNAADVLSKPLLGTSLDEIEHIIRVNVTGALQLCRLLAPQMASRGSGAIVNISSLAGYKANPTQTVYSISKAAVNGMSDALRAELGPRGVHVVNVALMGVGEGPGRIPVELVGQRIARAIARREPEIFFYHSTKWLMRLYKVFPPLARLR